MSFQPNEGSSRRKRSRFSSHPPKIPDEKIVPPPGVVHIASLGGKSKEEESTSGGTQGIDFNALPCTTYPSYDTYEAKKEKPDPKQLAKKVAAAAAAKINANLVAKGKIKLSELIPEQPLLVQKPELPSPQTVAAPKNLMTDSSVVPPIKATDITMIDGLYVSEVEINDIAIGCRNYLTRTITQDKITQTTKAYVCTKGKYMTTIEKANATEDDKPLYLHVQAASWVFVQSALEKIKQIIENHYQKKAANNTPAPPHTSSLLPDPNKPPSYPNFAAHASSAMAPLPAAHFIQEKVYIGLDGAPPNFDLKSHLLGENYQNFNFIASETGAQVILRGRGSGYMEPTSGQESFESMYAFVSHHTRDGVEAAKSLVLSLINTVQKELNDFVSSSYNVGHHQMQNMNTNYYNTYPQPIPPPPKPDVAQVPPPPIKPPKRKFTEEIPEVNNVLGYTAIKSLPSSSHAMKESEKSRSKSSTNSESKSNKKSRNESNGSNPPSSVTKDTKSDDGNFKLPSLPFWMTP